MTEFGVSFNNQENNKIIDVKKAKKTKLSWQSKMLSYGKD